MKRGLGQYFVIAFLFLWMLQFFSYVNLDLTSYGRFTRIICLFVFLFIFAHIYAVKKLLPMYPSGKFVALFIILPFATAISCYIEHGQSIFTSINAMFPHLILCIYFYFILKNSQTDKLINIIIIYAIIRTIITGIEQITYPNVLFAFRMDTYDENGFHPLEIRSGFYRFLISDAYYLPVFSGFYSFSKLLERFNKKHLIIFLICAFGVYMDQTRQVIFSFVVCLALLPILKRGKHILRYLLVVVLVISVLYSYSDILFGELMEKTSAQMDDTDIRLISYMYYFNNTGSFVSTLFGNGFNGSLASEYGREISRLQDMGLYRCDIGIVGGIHLLGYVFVSFFIFYYLFVVLRNWKHIDTFLQMMLISILCNIPLIFPLYNFTLASIEFFMGILFYLIDRSIIKNKTVWYGIKK